MAYLQVAPCRLNWPLAIQVHTPPALLAAASKALCKSFLQAPEGSLFFWNPTRRARPQSFPKRAHPARQAHQPLGPGTASHPQAASTGKVGQELRRSQHRFPSGPSTHALIPKVNPYASRHPPSRPPTFKAGGNPVQGDRSLSTNPSLTSARVKGQRTTSTAHQQHPVTTQTPQQQPPGRHLWLVYTSFSAHPPYSGKGPLLSACGLKCPWRVKRETTNSHLWACGTLPDFPISPKHGGMVGGWGEKKKKKRLGACAHYGLPKPS